MTPVLDYLGMVLAERKYALGRKSIQNILVGELPQSLREVKGLLGKLNFASLFVPNYTKVVAPIVRLLSKSSPGIW